MSNALRALLFQTFAGHWIMSTDLLQNDTNKKELISEGWILYKYNGVETDEWIKKLCRSRYWIISIQSDETMGRDSIYSGLSYCFRFSFPALERHIFTFHRPLSRHIFVTVATVINSNEEEQQPDIDQKNSTNPSRSFSRSLPPIVTRHLLFFTTLSFDIFTLKLFAPPPPHNHHPHTFFTHLFPAQTWWMCS